jgi:hypothetical protein
LRACVEQKGRRMMNLLFAWVDIRLPLNIHVAGSPGADSQQDSHHWLLDPKPKICYFHF